MSGEVCRKTFLKPAIGRRTYIYIYEIGTACGIYLLHGWRVTASKRYFTDSASIVPTNNNINIIILLLIVRIGRLNTSNTRARASDDTHIIII